jgi:hypothetical protein
MVRTSAIISPQRRKRIHGLAAVGVCESVPTSMDQQPSGVRAPVQSQLPPARPDRGTMPADYRAWLRSFPLCGKRSVAGSEVGISNCVVISDPRSAW